MIVTTISDVSSYYSPLQRQQQQLGHRSNLERNVLSASVAIFRWQAAAAGFEQCFGNFTALRFVFHATYRAL